MLRAAKITSLVAAVIFTAVFVIIWPGSMLSGDILLSFYQNTLFMAPAGAQEVGISLWPS